MFDGTYRPVSSYVDERNVNQVMPKALSKLFATTVLAATLVAMTPFAISTPASAVTCEETRGLTQEQLEYWARRLEVSSSKLSDLLDRAFCTRRTEPPDAWAMGPDVSSQSLTECNVTRSPNEGRKGWSLMSTRCAMRRPK
jgi:hypothetical protein